MGERGGVFNTVNFRTNLIYLLSSLDPVDQILLKNSKCLESLQIKWERGPCCYEANATRLGSNGQQEQEISHSVQNDKQAKKKGMLTVQSAQMLMW
jgi:hypothetical protein